MSSAVLPYTEDELRRMMADPPQFLTSEFRIGATLLALMEENHRLADRCERIEQSVREIPPKNWDRGPFA